MHLGEIGGEAERAGHRIPTIDNAEKSLNHIKSQVFGFMSMA